MDFHQMDIRAFLREAVPVRFADLDQTGFTALVQYLFEIDGYTFLPGVTSGELSHILHARRDESTAVLLALRLDPDTLVKDPDLDLIDRAREFYTADHAWIITTSGFSPEVRKAAKEMGIELWDWDALYEAISQLFFEGKHHTDYFADHPRYPAGEPEVPELALKVKWEAAEGVEPNWFNMAMVVSNLSDQNLFLHLELPALIDHKSQQVTADHWKDGEFTSGMIYAGASVRTNALFSVARVGDRPPGGRVVLTCHERRDVPVTYHLKARIRGEACFVVTYCYTRDSREYADMIRYRDTVLSQTRFGRCLIMMYYLISPRVVHVAACIPLADALLRRCAGWLVPKLQSKLRRRQHHTHPH